MDENILRNKLSLNLRALDDDYISTAAKGTMAQRASAYALALLVVLVSKLVENTSTD